MSERLHSIEYGTNAEVTAKMLRVLFPETETILDMTYGSGKFWGDAPPWRVTGVDLNPERARDVCADFTRLPFVDGAFGVAIFDPPYLSDPSRRVVPRLDAVFTMYPSMDVAHDTVKRGTAEAWRVSRLGVIVKVQNYSHSGHSVRMTRWIEEVIPEVPYGEVHRVNMGKMVPHRWGSQLSVYSVHTTFLAFRHGSQMHTRRPLALDVLAAAAPLAIEQLPLVEAMS